MNGLAFSEKVLFGALFCGMRKSKTRPEGSQKRNKKGQKQFKKVNKT